MECNTIILYYFFTFLSLYYTLKNTNIPFEKPEGAKVNQIPKAFERKTVNAKYFHTRPQTLY